MKEIKFDGVDVKGILSGKIVGKDTLSISKINMQGMLFETISRLNINNSYNFQIISGAGEITVAAKVVSALIKSSVKESSKTNKFYQVAVVFEKLKDEEKSFLEDVIDYIIESNVPSFDNMSREIKGAKFHARE